MTRFFFKTMGHVFSCFAMIAVLPLLVPFSPINDRSRSVRHVFSCFAMIAFLPLLVPFSAMIIDRSRSVRHVFSLKLSHRHRMMDSGVVEYSCTGWSASRTFFFFYLTLYLLFLGHSTKCIGHSLIIYFKKILILFL